MIGWCGKAGRRERVRRGRLIGHPPVSAARRRLRYAVSPIATWAELHGNASRGYTQDDASDSLRSILESTMAIDHDQIFKQLIESFFREFLELFCAEEARLMDFSRLKVPA